MYLEFRNCNRAQVHQKKPANLLTYCKEAAQSSSKVQNLVLTWISTKESTA